MIFGRRKNDVPSETLQDLAEAQRLSTLEDWESLERALAVVDGWVNFAKERGHPELGPPAAAIQQSVLLRMQRLGLDRCFRLLQTARKLLDEDRYDDACETVENAKHVIQRSHLRENSLASQYKLLNDKIAAIENDPRVLDWKAEQRLANEEAARIAKENSERLKHLTSARGVAPRRETDDERLDRLRSEALEDLQDMQMAHGDIRLEREFAGKTAARRQAVRRGKGGY